MNSIKKLLIILATCLMALPALAQEQQAAENGSNSVDGMFAGMNVGGSRRKVQHQARTNLKKPSKSDSFAVNPSDYARQVNNPNQNRVQTRQTMVPGMDVRPSQHLVQTVEPVATSENQNAQAPAPDLSSVGSGSTEYYNSLIDQVRGKSDHITQTGAQKSKYAITNENKF